jgi:hypothetical protein
LILHKLTEDILSCSLNMKNEKDQPQSDSWQRVNRLSEYKRAHPECCLVDDPNSVQILMSRSEIAHVLQTCLQGVTSASGRPVQAPKYVVYNLETTNSDALQDCLEEANISYPLIAKPLIAAGTKQSHYMSILLKASALHNFLQQRNSSCILQEYVNHNATLYKVYVLGDFVSVYQRHSLPNLPHNVSEGTLGVERPECAEPLNWCVEFDSQRPYPRLQDFGIHVGDGDDPAQKKTISSRCTSANHQITNEEVRPIVQTLRKAFGLELFGFDILVTAEEEERLLVVDVNYFPSYKEVPNFPSLLAQYLTQRVLQSRQAQNQRGPQGTDS